MMTPATVIMALHKAFRPKPEVTDKPQTESTPTTMSIMPIQPAEVRKACSATCKGQTPLERAIAQRSCLGCGNYRSVHPRTSVSYCTDGSKTVFRDSGCKSWHEYKPSGSA